MYNPTIADRRQKEHQTHISQQCENCLHVFYASTRIQFCSDSCLQEYEQLGPYERFTIDSPEMYEYQLND